MHTYCEVNVLIKKIGILLSMTVMGLLLVGSAPIAIDDPDWGPDLDTEIPDLDVKNTDGDEQTIEDLRGESKGILLFFARTSNW